MELLPQGARYFVHEPAAPPSGSALLESAVPESPYTNAYYGRNRIDREINPARMPTGDIDLENLDYCAEDHYPNAQNPLAPWIRQTKQEASD